MDDSVFLMEELEGLQHLMTDSADLGLCEGLLQVQHDAVHCATATELDVDLTKKEMKPYSNLRFV